MEVAPYISMQTCKYTQSYRHSLNDNKALQNIRQSHHHLHMICNLLHGVRSKVIFRHTQKIRSKMACDQVVVSKAIVKAVAEATTVAIHTMAVATAERPQSVAGPRRGEPAMKQPNVNWEVDDKYNELKSFRLEVNNILSTYNMPQTEQLAIVKNWLGRKGLQF